MKMLALFLLAASATYGAALPEAAKIDSLLAADWQKNKLQPNPVASDEVIVRRLYLDIAGRIPMVSETREFMQSNDPDKRAKLIDTLLGSDGYTSHLFNFWADTLRLTDNTKGKITAEAYEEWLKKELKANTPYDQLVKKLLTTEGGAWDSGSIGFYQRDENKLDHLAYTVQVFLGTSIVCAQCHNHPFDKWSQMDYYSMAAFTYGMDTRGNGVNEIKLPKKGANKKELPPELAKMNPKERRHFVKNHPEEVAKMRKEAAGQSGMANREEMQQVRKALSDVMKPLRYTAINWNEGKLPKLPDDYKYTDGKPGQTIEARAMFGHEAKPKEGQTTIQAFADWMASPENPRFTTVIANRMWKHVFGIGLIEPLDEMTDSTVASNPELMDYLGQLMIEKKYSLKSYLRVLYNTDTYQRMASTQEVALGETYHFTGPTLRRMSAEQVWDSMITLTKGNVDGEVDDDNQRLRQYLEDLNMFITTMKEKGPEGIIAAAKVGMEQRKENDRKLAEMRAEIAKQKGGKTTDPADAKALANAANRLRRQSSNELLEDLIGEERAQDLIEGYNPNKEKNKGMKVDRKVMANLSKEQRKELRNSAVDKTMVSRASELPSPARPGHFLRTFGQSDRELIDNANDDASVPQALTLLNGPMLESLTSPVSQFSQQLNKAGGPDEKVALVYESLLSRRPTNNERAVLSEVIHERGDAAIEDVTHALITGSQFLFIQ